MIHDRMMYYRTHINQSIQYLISIISIILKPIKQTKQYNTNTNPNTTPNRGEKLFRPRIRNIQHQNISRPNLNQLIHHRRHALLLHHRANSHPALLFQRRDGGRALAGGDARGRGELGAGDVVLAEDVFLGGCSCQHLSFME